MVKAIKTEDGYLFHVDGNELALRSKYFKAALHYESQPCILIPGVTGYTMKQILYYMKTGCFLLTARNIFDLLVAADYLLLDDAVKEICCAFPRKIFPGNCIDFLHGGLNLNHLNVAYICCCFIRTHFESVASCVEIGNLTLEIFKLLLTQEKLKLYNEATVWKAIVKWVEKEPSARIAHVPSLLTRVRLEMCSEETIREIINHPFILKNDIFKDVISQYSNRKNNYKKSFIEFVKSLSSEPVDLGPRQRRILAAVLKTKGISIEIVLVSNEGQLIRTIPLKGQNLPLKVFVIGPKIYMLNYQKCDFVYFNLLSGEWNDIRYYRGWNGVDVEYFVVNSQIHATWTFSSLCGWLFDTYYSTHQSVALFVAKDNKWITRERKQFSHEGHSTPCKATVHEDFLYTLGVYNEDDSLFPFGAKYDTATDTWSEFVLPEVRSKDIAIVSCDGLFLLVQAGDTSVQRFHSEEGVWRPFQKLPFAYHTPQAEVRNEAILIFDLDDDCQKCRAIFWDGKSHQWRDGTQLLRSPSYCVVEDLDVVRIYHNLAMDNEWQEMLRYGDQKLL